MDVCWQRGEREAVSLSFSLSLSLSLSCSLLLSSMGVLVERSSPTASRHVLRLDRDIGDPPHLILFVWLSVVISQIFRNIRKSRDGSHVHSRLPACSGFILSPFVIEIASASRSVRHISSVPVNLSLSVIVLRDFWIRIVCETSILFDEAEPSTARIGRTSSGIGRNHRDGFPDLFDLESTEWLKIRERS